METNEIVQEILMKCKSISQELEKSADSIQRLSQILTEVNSLKFRAIGGIMYYDTNLSEKRKEELISLLKNDDMKKVLNSSTLTKTYIDGKLSDSVIPRETLHNCLRGLYSTEDNIRTLISKQKFLETV